MTTNVQDIFNDFFKSTARHVVRPLDSKFTSFGEAAHSYLEMQGYQEPDSKQVNVNMCKAFCEALRLPYIVFDSDDLTRHEHYFESDTWIYQHLEANGFERIGSGNFMKLDEHYRPIAMASVKLSRMQNIEVKFCGVEDIVLAGRAEVIKHLKAEEQVEARPAYYEVVMSGGGRGMMFTGGEGLSLMPSTIEIARETKLEYYPYLDGGFEALMSDFLQSEESVLILMGAPGTGKSSAIMAATEALNLMPIYAKKTDVVMDKKFVSYVFGVSDEYMTKVAGTSARRRTDLFKDEVTLEREFLHSKSPFVMKDEEEKEPRIPFIVVEDADLLLAPRSQGNLAMAELLNETDGISSNHARKIVFTTNLGSENDIDSALIRDGRCYAVVNFRYLTPDEAIKARAAADLPPFDEVPTRDVALATALRKPRKRICMTSSKNGIGFTTK